MTNADDEILSQIPGYIEAQARDTRARGEQDATPGPTFAKVQAELVARVHNMLANGEDIPLDIGAPLVEAEKLDKVHGWRRYLLTLGTPTTVSQFAKDFLSSHTVEAYALINRELEKLSAEVRKIIPALGAVRTANEAIAAGPKAIAAWQKLSAATERYEALRRVQIRVISVDFEGTPITPELRALATVREALDVHPDWVARRHDMANLNTGGTPGEGSEAYVTWMREARVGWVTEVTDDVWPVLDRPGHLLHLVREFTLWAPDGTTLRRLYAAANSATATNEKLRPIGQARREAYRLAGIDNAYAAEADHDSKVRDLAPGVAEHVTAGQYKSDTTC
jgi:hypothetical protein